MHDTEIENGLIKYYTQDFGAASGLASHDDARGWVDYTIGNSLLYSHRVTYYDITTFPEKLTEHDFFELNILRRGQVSYTAGNLELFPSAEEILLIPPHVLHTGHLLQPCEYERFIFYFYTKTFEILSNRPFPSLLQREEPVCLKLPQEQRCELFYLLSRLDCVLVKPENTDILLAYSYILQIFNLISVFSAVSQRGTRDLPENVIRLKSYVDDNYLKINSIPQIAAHFFYSREYVSRIFKQYYNISIGDYIALRRTDHARMLLEEGKSISAAFQACGYHSMSAFINAFKKSTGMTPSKYRQQYAGALTINKAAKMKEN